MSFTVFVIAAAHAIPVVWAANRWGTRTSVILLLQRGLRSSSAGIDMVA
jgi:hypothetical protein